MTDLKRAIIEHLPALVNLVCYHELFAYELEDLLPSTVIATLAASKPNVFSSSWLWYVKDVDENKFNRFVIDHPDYLDAWIKAGGKVDDYIADRLPHDAEYTEPPMPDTITYDKYGAEAFILDYMLEPADEVQVSRALLYNCLRSIPVSSKNVYLANARVKDIKEKYVSELQEVLLLPYKYWAIHQVRPYVLCNHFDQTIFSNFFTNFPSNTEAHDLGLSIKKRGDNFRVHFMDKSYIRVVFGMPFRHELQISTEDIDHAMDNLEAFGNRIADINRAKLDLFLKRTMGDYPVHKSSFDKYKYAVPDLVDFDIERGVVVTKIYGVDRILGSYNDVREVMRRFADPSFHKYRAQ